jgi:pimeloyl-ACP methyl ester carboxylesterase
MRRPRRIRPSQKDDHAGVTDGEGCVLEGVLSRDGRRKLAVESLGAPDGEPVFLLHGTPGGRSGPRPRPSVLYRGGIRLISYSRPGYTGSDRKERRTVADAAADVEDIANYFEIKRFIVIGRSGGAPHALGCAALLPGRVTCAAALCSLAPYKAPGLNWTDGMVPSNVKAYRDAEDDLGALIETLHDHARQLQDNPEGLLRFLGPDLAEADRRVIGDIALRRKIAETHTESMRDGIDGWVDDVRALGNQDGWGFKLTDIDVPVYLWHGADDKFSPPGHAQWLASQIAQASLIIESGEAHFDAVKRLPEILKQVVSMSRGEVAGPGCATSNGALSRAPVPAAARYGPSQSARQRPGTAQG